MLLPVDSLLDARIFRLLIRIGISLRADDWAPLARRRAPPISLGKEA
jgi:hypothetical protein